MSCQISPAVTEFEWFQSLDQRADGQCTGPLVSLSLWPWQVFQLERIPLESAVADVLWSGFVADRYTSLVFALCASHWFDLAWEIGRQAQRCRRRDWAQQSGSVLYGLCYAAGWDQKEIANLVVNKGARLT